MTTTAERAEQKRQQRAEDVARLARGDVSVAGLSSENSIFSALPLSTFRITAIGGKPIKGDRR